MAHYENVVSLVDLPFNLESLLKRHIGVVQELALVFIFLLDVGIDVAILRFLVLDKIEKTLVDSNLQLLVIIRVLDYLVYGIFKVVNASVVVPNDVSVGLNRLLNDTLPEPQVFYHVTQTRINIVVILSESFIHGSSTVPQSLSLNLLRRNVFSEISNFLIKHKLEFF